jgi:hypothetical protein
MKGIGEFFSALVLGIIAIAIASVVFGPKSIAPQAIQATASGLGTVIGAAVQPIQPGAAAGTVTGTSLANAAQALAQPFNSALTNGDLGSNVFSAPSLGQIP